MHQRLKEKAAEAAQALGLPSFYEKHRKELIASSAFFEGSALLRRCMPYLDAAQLHPAHGIEHCVKVAIEGGALVEIECSRRGALGAERDMLMTSVQIAGLLHDIKRREKDHSVAGSREAERILEGFDVDRRQKRYITAAIRNHEAFREVLGSEDEAALLVSDSLYDADKFRWGPDNFITTVWLIIESAELSLEVFCRDFLQKVEGIKRIKGTFRTETGKAYGPEFIDLGLEIGNAIYHEMGYMIRS